MTEFESFTKIARLSRECVITEKIDGTNACVFIGEDGEFLTGSRTRWITPQDDNFGFSKWAHDHKDELFTLGPGRHFGEWWGVGVQRNYGLSERRFSLFNTSIWLDDSIRPSCCHVVPVLASGIFSSIMAESALETLRANGSAAAPGFMKAEGIVLYHVAANRYFKKTCEHDEEPKNAHVKKERIPKPPRDPNTGGRRIGLTPGYAGQERRSNATSYPPRSSRCSGLGLPLRLRQRVLERRQ